MGRNSHDTSIINWSKLTKISTLAIQLHDSIFIFTSLSPIGYRIYKLEPKNSISSELASPSTNLTPSSPLFRYLSYTSHKPKKFGNYHRI